MTQATIDYQRLGQWKAASVGTDYPLARASDPLTSIKAAERARLSGLVGTHEQRILAVLRATGQPMTASEIGALCNLSNVQVHRRMGAIMSVDANRIEKDERGHVCSVTGQRCETFQFCSAQSKSS